MQVFKSHTPIRIRSEFKSWGITLLIIWLVYIVLNQFGQINRMEWSVIGGIFLLKIGNTLSQFVVSEIHVDHISDTVTFVLQSPLSGQKTQVFLLHEMQSELFTHN